MKTKHVQNGIQIERYERTNGARTNELTHINILAFLHKSPAGNINDNLKIMLCKVKKIQPAPSATGNNALLYSSTRVHFETNLGTGTVLILPQDIYQGGYSKEHH